MNGTRNHNLGRLTLLMLFVTACIGLQSAQAQTFSVLYTFSGRSDGAIPKSALVADSAGNLYGTTYNGGDLSLNACGGAGCGVVFKIDSTGTYSVLHAFEAKPDGSLPEVGLTMTGKSTFVGTTLEGGSSNNGTIYKIDSSGNEKVVHSFHVTDGQNPLAGLTRDSSGNLYGVAQFGGVASSACGGGCGVAFKVTPSGTLTVLHDFVGGTDGEGPQSTPILDASGNLYGTTVTGGTGPCTTAGTGCGVIYKIDPSGNETILHTFVQTDGESPLGGLTMDAAGNLYGAAFAGGTANAGTVYKLDTAGNLTVLYNFTGKADGTNPSAALILDSSNNLYGTTLSGGSTACPSGCGVLFRISSLGNYAVLHHFIGTDGANPEAPLLLYHGALYGTASSSTKAGVVFKIAF